MPLPVLSYEGVIDNRKVFMPARLFWLACEGWIE
jgi:hypothetical protein